MPVINQILVIHLGFGGRLSQNPRFYIYFGVHLVQLQPPLSILGKESSMLTVWIPSGGVGDELGLTEPGADMALCLCTPTFS